MKYCNFKYLFATRYIKYRRYVDMCEYINRNVTYDELLKTIYFNLGTKNYIDKIEEELKCNSKFYLELYKNLPENIIYKKIYKESRELLLFLKAHNMR